MEIWKDVVGYEGVYQVSSLGRVKSFQRYPVVGRILKPGKTTAGYLQVVLCRDGEQQHKLVHRLVAEAFLPRSPGNNEVNHKNGDKADNRVENLEWVTSSENRKHAIETLGTGLGSANGNSKLTDRKVHQIRKLYATGKHTLAELAKMFDVALSTIGRVVRGDSWAHTSGRCSQDNYARGEQNGTSGLARREVKKIRKLYATSNHTQRELAEMFGVTQQTISLIVNRKSWKHIP